MKTQKYVILVISLLFSCRPITPDSSNTNDNSDAPSSDNTQNVNNNENEANDNSSDNENSGDDCGNDVGNGQEIINGPLETDPPIDNDSVFRSLVVDPRDADVLFCGSERNGFLKSVDGGVSWSQLRAGLRHSESPEQYPEVWNVAFSPADSDTIIAATTASAGPLIGDSPSAIAGIYRSIDGGANWFRSNCGLSNAKIGYVQFASSDGEVVLAAVQGEAASFESAVGEYFDGGIYRSTDRGESWSLTTMPAGATQKNSYWIIRQGGDAYYTFGFNLEDTSLNAGFLKSEDNGQTWTPFAEVLQQQSVTHFDVSSDGQIIYALPRGSFLFERSTDGGLTWEQLPDVSPGPQGPIAICPDDDQTVLFTSNADLRRTIDGMTSDTVVLTANAAIEWITFAPSNSTVIYAATQGYDVYKSTDKGATFVFMTNLREIINAD